MNFFISFSESKKSVTILLICILCLISGIFIFHKTARVGLELSPLDTPRNLTLKTLGSYSYKAEIISLGISHSQAVLPKVLEIPTLELWSPAQTFAETEFVLQFMKDRFEHVKVILLPISIGITDHPPRINPHTLTNFIYTDPFRTINLISSESNSVLIKTWGRAIMRYDNWRDPIAKLFNAETNREFESRKKKVDQIIDPFLIDRAEIHKRAFIDKNVSKNKQSNWSILKRIASQSKEMGACLVFYESPVSIPYIKTMLSYRPELADWKKEYQNFVTENNNDYCICFLEDIFSMKERNNKLYYFDQDHLNSKGAELFSIKIKARLLGLFPNFFNKHSTL